MDTFLQDLRYAARTLGRMRGVAIVAILTLALGIGATTTVFSIVYAALLRPLPFEESERLVSLYVTSTTARDGLQRMRWSRPEIVSLGSSLSSLEDVASFTSTNVNLTSGGDPEQMTGEVVSPAYFRLLRITPQNGRVFLPEEDTVAGAHPVAVISARLWRRRFGSDPATVGQQIAINQVPLTIVGILPEGFSGLSGRAEMWIPATMAPRISYAEYLTTPQHFISLVGRLKPGVSLAQATAELEAVAPRIVVPERTTAAGPVTWGGTMWPIARARIDAGVQRSVLLFLAAVVCVLLIACVNVASLLLARARGRRREIAIRLAIGSGRSRLVRQLLTESLLLAALGGICGTAIAAWAVHIVALPAVMAGPRNLYMPIGAFAAPAIDGAVWLFALGVTLGTSILFGLAPALETSRPDLVTALKEDGRGGAVGSQRRLLAGLVMSEVALAVLLLTGAGLLLKSFAQMQNLRGGFDPGGVVTFFVNPPASRYAPQDGPAVIERLLTHVQQVPGVRSATVSRCVPFTGCSRSIVFFPGQPADPSRAPGVGRHYVSADYFRTLGIPLRSGRALTDDDRDGRPPVTVINETAARRFWPGENPIGKRVWFGGGTGFMSPDRSVEIVGVVGDVQYESVDQAVRPDFYTSYLQYAFPDTMVIVKTDLAVPAIIPSLRRAVASVDSGVPIYDVQTLDERVAGALSRPRFNAVVLAAFATTALLLAAIGVYGVMAYSVSARLQEIGVRLALGADARRIFRLVLGQSARLAGAGALVGLVAALGLTRLMRSLLFDVAPTDPFILAAVIGVMIGIALLAAFLPARRASAVDPIVVLRNE